MAIIVKKNQDGIFFRSVSGLPPTVEERRKARELDSYLQKEIPKIEDELKKYGLSEDIPKEEDIKRGGNAKIWYELGKRLGGIADNSNLVKGGERILLWQAIRQFYATPRILRKDRGATRLHLEYCYRLSKLPWKSVQKFQWDDWVYLLDSKSLRMDPRSDKWMQKRASAIAKLSRSGLRTLVQRLNKKFKNKDTSVFSQTELFEKYDEVLDSISST